MKKLEIFKSEEFGDVEIVLIDDEPWFGATMIAKALGYKDPYAAIKQHCKEKGSVIHPVLTNGGKQEMKFINEGNLYRLITKSKMKKAEEFETWVFEDILPTIRKTGGFVANDDLFINTYFPNADEATKGFMKTNLETIRKQNETIAIKDKEINYKTEVIHGLAEDITLVDKRQILNEVMRKSGSKFQDRWNKLYSHFEKKYHVNLKRQMTIYNESNKPKMKNKLDYVEDVLGKLPELYEVAVKLFENDVKKLVQELYDLNDIQTTA